MKINENTNVALPIRNLLAIVGGVAMGVWAYFGIVETLNVHSTKLKLMESDLEKNTEFRIKWPRGEMGSLPADSEQFMLIEDLYKTTEKLEKNQEMNMTNKIKIQFLEEQLNKALKDIEKLKDSTRDIKYSNGNGS
tara:strand:- start:1292 stop:1699 length:408 start_codon:yes stop_codon:yes gene_type:complete